MGIWYGLIDKALYFAIILCLFITILAFATVGNELSGSGVGARVGAEQYGKDVIKLKGFMNELYKKSILKPSLIAPGGFFHQEWYTKLLQVSGSSVVNVVTHHLYDLGAGV
jgi:heparanase 1